MTTVQETVARRRVRLVLLSHLRRNLTLTIPYIAAAVVFGLGALAVTGFASRASLDNMLSLTAILAIVAGGQTLVIIGGGIDLSVPWVMTGSGIITSYLAAGQNAELLWVVPLVVGLAALVGLGNGLGVTILAVPPIVMTLAMNVVLSGAVILYALRQPSQARAPGILRALIVDSWLRIPAYLYVIAATVLAFTILLSLMRYGRRLYAIGTSPRTARLSGVNVRNVTIMSYVLSSVAGAFAGMLLLGYVNNVFFGMGDVYLFTSISAVVVGGASILGGSGHFIGTLGGALLLTIASSLLIALALGPGTISIFYGLIILVSVIVLSDRVRGAFGRGRVPGFRRGG